MTTNLGESVVLCEDIHSTCITNLQSGSIYLFKNGDVMLYIGRDVANNYVFQKLMGVVLYKTPIELQLPNSAAQYAALQACVDTTMKNPCNPLCLVSIKRLPTIYFEWNLEPVKKGYENWYLRSMGVNNNLPRLTFEYLRGSVDNWYTHSKDLFRGLLYYVDTDPIRVYLYLGRQSDGSFVWSAIKNVADLQMNRNNVAFWLQNNIKLTEKSKRVRRLDDITDDDVEIPQEFQPYIGVGYHINLSDIYVRDLDKIEPVEG